MSLKVPDKIFIQKKRKYALTEQLKEKIAALNCNVIVPTST